MMHPPSAEETELPPLVGINRPALPRLGVSEWGSDRAATGMKTIWTTGRFEEEKIFQLTSTRA